MDADRNDHRGIDRRRFVQSLMLPAAVPVVAALAGSTLNGAAAQAAEPSPEAAGQAAAAEPAAAGPDIIDSNVHLFDWPFRKLKYARTEALVAKLRKHRITQAWAGSFAAVLHKQLDQINRELAEECRTRADGMLVPIDRKSVV